MNNKDSQKEIFVLYPERLTIPGVPAPNGWVHFWEDKSLFPVGIQRCFWISGVKDGDTRGYHAHWEEGQVLVAVTGSVTVQVLSVDGTQRNFNLENPSQAVYIPPLNWVEVVCSSGAVVLGLSDREFSEIDYIRDKTHFEKLREAIR
jgi:hypothetical protein